MSISQTDDNEKYENIDPNSTEVDSIWIADELGRDEEAKHLQNFVEHAVAQKREFEQVGSLTLNLDSGWGDGKTFFLKRLSKQLEASGHVSIYVDAWAADHLDDPLLPLLAGIDAELKQRIGVKNNNLGSKATTAWQAAKRNALPLLGMVAKGAAKSAVKKVIGEAAEDVSALLNGKVETESGAGNVMQTSKPQAIPKSEKSLLPETVAAAVKGTGDTAVAEADALINGQINDYQARINAKESFAQHLSTLASAINKNNDNKLLVVLLDEIDRCRPTFALEMLERIKHFFDVDGVVFIVAADTEQLEHSIRAVYGQGFDAVRYLHRFFEQTMRLAPAAMDQLIEVRGSWMNVLDDVILPGQISYQLFIVKLAEALNLNAREIISVLERLRRFFLERTQPYGFAPAAAILIAFLQKDHDNGLNTSATEMFKVISEFDSRIDILEFKKNRKPISIKEYCTQLLKSSRSDAEFLRSEIRKESLIYYEHHELAARSAATNPTFNDIVQALIGLDKRWGSLGDAADN